MKIAFQGIEGSYSHASCLQMYQDAKPISCASFEEALEMVGKGSADLAMIPLENSSAGRVADMHLLLPSTKLHMIAEYFHPVHHCLMCSPDGSLETVQDVYSHPQALAQCKQHLKEHSLIANAFNDTATAAKMVSGKKDATKAALASKLAAEIYGLKILAENFQDFSHNTTRFIVFSKKEVVPDASAPCITSFIFKVKNIPAALYKAMGGFATNNVNMLKLESYMLDGKFSSTQFYVDIDGHKDDPAVRRAFEELSHFADNIKILGCYPENRANLL
jgi:prephenate dehydratase